MTHFLKVAYLGNANEPHFQEWIPALQKVGLEVVFISFVKPTHPIPSLQYHLLPHQGKLSWKTFLWSDVKELKTLLSELKPDILLASHATNYGLLAQRIGFHPCVVQTWTWDLTVLPQIGWRKFFFKPLVAKVLHFADAITTDGVALKTIGERIFPEVASKMEATTWGIRIEAFEARDATSNLFQKPDGMTVFTLCRGIDSIYQPEKVLPVLFKFVEAHPTVFGVVLGLGHTPDETLLPLLDQIKQHPRMCFFAHRIPKHQMQDIWQATDFAISTPVADGISEALLENMLCGAIPIVNDIPSNRALLGDGRALFMADMNPQTIEKTMQEALTMSESRKHSLKSANEAWVRNYTSQEKTALQIKQLFERLIQKAR